VLRHQPQMLLESELLVTTYQCGCAALNLQHREAGRSACRFFEALIDVVRRPKLADKSLAAVRELLGLHGVQLVVAIVSAIAGALPASRVRFVAPLLRPLIEIETQTCRTWATSAVQDLPAESHPDGVVFVEAIFSHEALCDDKIFTSAAEAFSNACRRRKVAQ